LAALIAEGLRGTNPEPVAERTRVKRADVKGLHFLRGGRTGKAFGHRGFLRAGRGIRCGLAHRGGEKGNKALG